MTINATIKVNGEITHERSGFANIHDARKWASVQGIVGFDFVPMGTSKCSYIDVDRNASLTLARF